MRAHRTRGFGLLEIILVFAVLLGAGAVIFGLFESAQTRSEAHTQAENARTAMGNMASTLGAHHDYSALPTGYFGDAPTSATAASFFPKSMVQANGSTIQSPWGTVTLNNYRDSFSYGLPTNSQYVMVFNNVPPDVCPYFLIDLINQVNGFYSVQVGPTGQSFASVVMQKGAYVGAPGTANPQPSFGNYEGICTVYSPTSVILIGS
jgi:type II secretory pathway pseudopilin PulG